MTGSIGSADCADFRGFKQGKQERRKRFAHVLCRYLLFPINLRKSGSGNLRMENFPDVLDVLRSKTLRAREPDLDRRICLLRIPNHGVVRLHIARACI